MRKIALLFIVASARAATNVSLPAIPSGPPAHASQVLDRRLASLSIEFAYLPTFAGNKTHPNRLTGEIMKRIVERTGLGPDIRSGGNTIDSSVFDANAPALSLTLSDSLKIYRTTFGPAYFESYRIFPDTSRFILNVNLKNDSVKIAQNEIKAAFKYLDKGRIYSIQLGNEPDLYQRAEWTSATYTAKFLNWTSTLTEALDLPPRIFQAGAIAKIPRSTAPMTTLSIINDGIDKTGVVKLFDQHTYQYSTCTSENNTQATLESLLNHTSITAYWDQWQPQIAAARSLDKEFVMGEFGSVSCSGKQNVSDTFGQALWLSDVLLYGASLNISRMYLHQGATLIDSTPDQVNGPGLSWYDLWYPVASERYGPARVSPSFVAYLLVTEAVGPSGRARIALIRDALFPPTLAVYAIWDPSAREDGVARMVVLNMALRLEGAGANEVETVMVDVSRWARNGKEIKVKRMSAPGMNSKDVGNVMWAGQSYTDGVPVGKLDVEKPEGGQVSVKGSEGVLVVF
ncbi:hypothetical protein FRC07_000039 [Ceratobasidium sp. 392]|nr:hypothetical protein FRC07_000039 [Ceratobasidium sp. 392]